MRAPKPLGQGRQRRGEERGAGLRGLGRWAALKELKAAGCAQLPGVTGLASAGRRRRCGAGPVGGDRASMAAAGGERGEAAPREEAMAGAGEEEEDGEENILYDLLVNTEWPPETEVQVRVAAARPGCGGGDRPRRRGRGCAPLPRGLGGPRRGAAVRPEGRGDGALPAGRLRGLPAPSLAGTRAGRAAGVRTRGVPAVSLPLSWSRVT